MLVIGITGGIACGKSTVAKMFRALGAELIDADLIVRGLYKKPAVAAKIKKAFGQRAVAGAGAVAARARKKAKSKPAAVNRGFLANLVFSDARKLKKLNSLVHPMVVREIKRRVAKSRASAVVVDVPLLFEANLSKMFDFAVVVCAGRKAQLSRLRKRGLPPGKAKARIAAQMPLREKVKLADFVIVTEGTKKQTALRVKRVFGELGAL